jgi:hypothetical protein
VDIVGMIWPVQHGVELQWRVQKHIGHQHLWGWQRKWLWDGPVKRQMVGQVDIGPKGMMGQFGVFPAVHKQPAPAAPSYIQQALQTADAAMHSRKVIPAQVVTSVPAHPVTRITKPDSVVQTVIL